MSLCYHGALMADEKLGPTHSHASQGAESGDSLVLRRIMETN